MKRKLLLVVLCGFLGACAPTNQVNLLDEKKQEMGNVIDSCEETTRNADNPHTACVSCTFDAWAVLLKEADFKDMDLLDSYRNRMIKIATAWDDGTLTDKKATTYFKDAKNQFTYSVQKRDAIRQQNYTNAMLAVADGLNQAPQYHPTLMPSYTLSTQPSMPPVMFPASGNNSLMNSYIQPPPAPMGIGEGAQGYGGKVYVPAGADPNPPINGMGQ